MTDRQLSRPMFCKLVLTPRLHFSKIRGHFVITDHMMSCVGKFSLDFSGKRYKQAERCLCERLLSVLQSGDRALPIRTHPPGPSLLGLSSVPFLWFSENSPTRGATSWGTGVGCC